LSWVFLHQENYLKEIALIFSSKSSVAAAVVSSPFYYDFKESGTLEEAGSMNESRSPYWWLNSGGYMYIKDGVGKTVQGDLSRFSIWRLAYAKSNPTDTGEGFYPQNIFRLVTRSEWQDFSQEAYFKINKDNLSDSPNRNASNGLLLFSRYKDGNNLYYAGVRVDGSLVIKKKLHGDYFTLAIDKIIPGDEYDKQSNPNLLPKNTWIGLKSEVINGENDSVIIRLYTDIGRTGVWKLGIETVDDGKTFEKAVTSKGYAGIRTDFMDVEFSGYKIVSL